METGKARIKKGKIIMIAVIAAIAIFVLATAPRLVETVKRGTYQVKQAAISGKMTAKLTPGMYGQMFGDIVVWPKAETFYFTADAEEGTLLDQSIEIRFNDGSLCKISGTMRVILPITESQAVALVEKLGFQKYEDLQQKLILPVTRNALRLTANLMTARESYAEKRPDFIFWAWDQIQNGLYQTQEVEKEVEDLTTGKKIRKAVKVIRRDGSGSPLYQENPLEGMGLNLQNFEIKIFVYSDKVKAQIETQQEAYMQVATAKAKAEEAKQQAKTAEEIGKANVMKAQYEKEQEKIKAVVDANKKREVAEIAAEQRLNVAKLDKKAAAETKQQEILLGEGEATRKRLVLAADGALKQKLTTLEAIHEKYAAAFSIRPVPSIVMGGGDGGTGEPGSYNSDAMMFQRMINLWLTKQLGVDLTVPQGKTLDSQIQ